MTFTRQQMGNSTFEIHGDPKSDEFDGAKDNPYIMVTKSSMHDRVFIRHGNIRIKIPFEAAQLLSDSIQELLKD